MNNKKSAKNFILGLQQAIRSEQSILFIVALAIGVAVLTSADVLKSSLDADEVKAYAGDIAQPCETVILPHASLDRALQLMSAHGEDFLPVVDDTGERHI